MKKSLLISLLLFLVKTLLPQSGFPSNNFIEITDSLVSKTQQEVIYTPFGPALKSNIHFVNNNYHLLINGSSIQLVQTKTGVISQEFNYISTKYETNSLSDSKNETSLSSISSQDGWITYAECQVYVPNPKTTYFSAEWIVPSPPLKYSDQIIYLFIGLEGTKILDDGNSAYILQPVLQWGETPAGGGKYWAICNWLVFNRDQFFYDSLIKVNSGDKLQGVIKLTSNSDTSYAYNSSFTGYPTGLDVYNLPRLETPYFALEAYNIEICDEYPADEKIRMQNIQILTNTIYPPLIWYTYNTVDICGQFTNIINESSNNGEVNIHFHKPYTEDGFEDIFIYPNPVFNNVHISITKPVFDCKIEVYDGLGNLIHTETYKTLEYEYYLDFQNYKPGIYMIKIYYQDNLYTRETNHVFKVIKIRN